MRVLCKYSGLEFACDHVPGFLHAREASHPIFTLNPHKILSYAGKWGAGQLTTTDSYLLFLAGLHSTELIEWRVPVEFNTKTNSIVAQNMSNLFSVLGKLDVIKNPIFAVPRYVISPETKTLENVRHWLEAWIDSYRNFQDGYKSVSLNQKILRKEAALERLIKSSHRSPTSYSAILAEWANLAGDFPTFQVTIGTESMTCAEYWKSLIVRCSKSDALWKVSATDLKELIEHCEENLEAGSIYYHTLMKYLWNAHEEISNPLGFGAPGLRSTPFRILEEGETDTVETANLLAIIDSAPEVKPELSQYATKIDYLKAKMAYDLAQKHKKSQPEPEPKSQPEQVVSTSVNNKFDL